MKVVAIVQARMGSSRLPGKVLRDLAGDPMLARVMARLSRAKTLDQIVVATSIDAKDDVVAELCRKHQWSFFRGNENDVLDRYYGAALEVNAKVIVRITADCPLVDPDIVDRLVTEFMRAQPDVSYVSNVEPTRTFPHGLDVEVFGYAALERAWREDANPAWREHVTPYLYRSPDSFAIRCVRHREDLSTMRWTVDTQEDWELVSKVFTHFRNDCFSWLDVLDLIREKPELQRINERVVQRTVP